MKTNTKLLLGAGAALGVGYLLMKKSKPLSGLGAASDNVSPDIVALFSEAELEEFSEFDGSYFTAYGFKADFGDVVQRIAERRGGSISEDQADQLVAAARAAGVGERGSKTELVPLYARIQYYGPFVAQALASVGLSTPSDDSGSQYAGADTTTMGDAPCGGDQVNVGTTMSDAPVCEAPATEATVSSSTYHTKDLGDACSRSSDCVGDLLCVGGVCVTPKKAGSSTTVTVTAPGGKPATAVVTTTKDGIVKKKTKDDSGISGTTYLLLGGLALAAVFLLSKKSAPVSVVPAPASGKLNGYRRRMARASGVNGLRGKRRASR